MRSCLIRPLPQAGHGPACLQPVRPGNRSWGLRLTSVLTLDQLTLKCAHTSILFCHVTATVLILFKR